MQSFGLPWPVLSSAATSVLVELLIHGPASRADLARRSGLSPASLTRITRTLVDSGLLTESDATAPRVRTGRPSLPMDVNVDLVHLIGVNLTSRAMTMVRTDLRGRILAELEIGLPATDPATVVELIAYHVGQQKRVDPAVRAIGLSMAGPVSPRSEIIRMSPFLGWTEVPIVEMVQNRTGLSTVVENDVRALTAAEHWFGAAAGCADFVLITLGAGVGCGVVVDNRLVEGLDGGSGQVGHLPITAGGPLCERGHRGCARSYLASSSIIRQVSGWSGRLTLTYEDVLELARADDPIALRVVQDAGEALGVVIGTVASITAPAKVLLSGEGVPLLDLVADRVRERAAAVQHWSLPTVVIEIAPFTFTEWARGAAVMALRRQIEAATVVES